MPRASSATAYGGIPVAPNGALAAGPGRALPAALGLALSWAFSQIRY